MGLVCSSNNHKLLDSSINEMNLSILIAENFIYIIGQLELSDDIHDDLRYNLNQLIILRSKLAHCIVRIHKRYSQYHYKQLENELTSVIQYLDIIQQDVYLKVYFPLLYTFLVNQLEIHKQNLKQKL